MVCFYHFTFDSFTSFIAIALSLYLSVSFSIAICDAETICLGLINYVGCVYVLGVYADGVVIQTISDRKHRHSAFTY